MTKIKTIITGFGVSAFLGIFIPSASAMDEKEEYVDPIAYHSLTGCKRENDEMRLVISRSLANQYSDMVLSPFPLSPCPPIFVVTLPRGQKILVVGTIHTFPLGCLLPYKVVQKLIGASDFVLNEIAGVSLCGQSRGRKKKIYEILNDAEVLESAYIQPTAIARIKDATVKMYNGVGAEYRESFAQDRMDKIFDKNGCWYEKAGIIAAADSSPEFVVNCVPEEEVKCRYQLSIKGRVFEIGLNEYKELHPIALEALYYGFTQESLFTPTPWGIDYCLDSMARDLGKPIFALEEHRDRWGKDAIDSFTKKIISEDAFGLEFAIGRMKKVEQKAEYGTFGSLAMNLVHLYSGILPDDRSAGVCERNSLWVDRIMSLGNFKRSFGYVGMAHLLDLFTKFEKAGCKVSQRLPLADLEDMCDYL